MPLVRKLDEKIIGIGFSDAHLSLNPPRARKDKDWMRAMEIPLQEIRALQKKLDVPIFFSGDLFHHWKEDPELVNFALLNLPEMYAIPGQHDLPLHSLDLLKKSSFWTMVLAGKIHLVPMGHPLRIKTGVRAGSDPDYIFLYGFPWGEEISPLKRREEGIHIALCHDYFWEGDHCFPTAPKNKEARSWAGKIKGYDLVIFGDNHKGFITSVGGVHVLNCGGMMRRRSDEMDYRPQVGLIYESGRVQPYRLNTSEDKLVRLEESPEVIGMREDDLQEFLEELGDLRKDQIDFKDALMRRMTKIGAKRPIRAMVMRALEGGGI